MCLLLWTPSQNQSPWHTYIYIPQRIEGGSHWFVCCNSFSFCNSSHFGSGCWLVEETEETPTDWRSMELNGRQKPGIFRDFPVWIFYFITLSHLSLSVRQAFGRFLTAKCNIAELQHAAFRTFLARKLEWFGTLGPKSGHGEISFRCTSADSADFSAGWTGWLSLGLLYEYTIYFTVYIYMFPDCRWGRLLRACMCGKNSNSSIVLGLGVIAHRLDLSSYWS